MSIIKIVTIASIIDCYSTVLCECSCDIEHTLMPIVVDVISPDKDVKVEQDNDKKEPTDGSGFIVSDDGYIVTNNHVIASAEKIKIVLNNGNEYVATVVGKDDRSDVALLKIDAHEKLPYAKFANSDKVHIGDDVLAIGNPMGIGKSVTSGIISYRSRNLSRKMAELGEVGDLVSSFIQTDAAVNHGNSGGPLFLKNCEVVGMVTVFFANGGYNTGINFAIPSNMLVKVISQLKLYGKMQRSWLGIVAVPFDVHVAQALGLGNRGGCDITRVELNSPAERAGIQCNDVLLSVNDENITEETNIEYLLNNLTIGTVIPIQIMRNGVEMKLSIKVGSKSDEDSEIIEDSEKVKKKEINIDFINKIGIGVTNITQDLRKYFNIPSDVEGVIIVDVSKLSTNSISYGDVIIKINQSCVKCANDVSSVLRKFDSKLKYVALYVYSPRKPYPFYVSVELRKESAISALKEGIIDLIESPLKEIRALSSYKK